MRESMSFSWPSTFEAEPLIGWQIPPTVIAPSYSNDEEKKKFFGIELSKDHKNIFEAACKVFPDDANAALWISANWLNDPIVIATKDLYLKSVEDQKTLLDKEQLAARLLQFSEEKFNGRYIVENKDRLKALEIYGKLMGYLDKPDQSPTIINNNNNVMEIVIVDPIIKEPPKLAEVNNQPIIDNNDVMADLKLVS